MRAVDAGSEVDRPSLPNHRSVLRTLEGFGVAELMPVAIADGRPIAGGHPGAITRRLTDAFHALVRTEGTPLW